MAPAHQSFGAADAPAAHVDLGLQIQRQFAGVDRMPQFLLPGPADRDIHLPQQAMHCLRMLRKMRDPMRNGMAMQQP